MNASKRNDTKRKQIVINLLLSHYANAQIALAYSTPWELLVAVILSAQSTDIIVNKVTKQLFLKYKTLDDYIHANQQEFEQTIHSVGFYKNKTKNILKTASILREKYHDMVPQTMEEMLGLAGVARKTANIVLGNIYHKESGIPVDTHVRRISQRLRLVCLDSIGGNKKQVTVMNGIEKIDYIRDASPEKIENELMTVIPSHSWLKFSYSVIAHGRELCIAQKPKCDACFLRPYCPVSRIS